MTVPFDHILDTINLNDVADEPELLAEGEYHVKVMEPQVKETKDKSKHYISYYVLVQSGEHAGRRVYGAWFLSKEALWKMKKDFKAMGYVAPAGRPHPEELEGFEGLVQIKHRIRKDNGEKVADINWLGPVV